MIKYFKKMALASLLTAALCCGFLALSSPAEAACIYNDTIHPLTISGTEFNGWTIAPSNHRCTDGTGGEVCIQLFDAFRKNPISVGVFIKVDNHGWISVYKKSGGKWKVVSKHKDGSVKDVKYMVPLRP